MTERKNPEINLLPILDYYQIKYEPLDQSNNHLLITAPAALQGIQIRSAMKKDEKTGQWQVRRWYTTARTKNDQHLTALSLIEYCEKILHQKSAVNAWQILEKISGLAPLKNTFAEDEQKQANNFIAAYAAYELKTNQKAMDYCQKRGLEASDIEAFQIGFIPKGSFIRADAHKFGYSDEQLLKSGCFTMNEKYQKPIYTLSNRILFPVKNENKEISGFSGRIIPEMIQADGKKEPKYRNSINYEKSAALFGIDHIAPTQDHVVLVEGLMDVIGCHKLGLWNACATSGVDLSQEQMDMLKAKKIKEVTLMYDADQAGQGALQKAVKGLQKNDFNVSVIDMESVREAVYYISKDRETPCKDAMDLAYRKVSLATVLREKEDAFDYISRKVYLDGNLKLASIHSRYKEALRDQHINPANAKQINRFFLLIARKTGLDTQQAKELAGVPAKIAGPDKSNDYIHEIIREYSQNHTAAQTKDLLEKAVSVMKSDMQEIEMDI